MFRFFLLLIIAALLDCSEEWYYKKSFENRYDDIARTDTVIFPYNDKILSQYWTGDLIAFKSYADDLVVREFGEWLQYNPENVEEIWTTTHFDTLGFGLVLDSRVLNNQTGQLFNKVICMDTLINSVEMRKCDYVSWHENGNLSKTYSLITNGNPGEDGKLYGEDNLHNNRLDGFQ